MRMRVTRCLLWSKGSQQRGRRNRYAPKHTSVAARSFLKGFRGYVLADASAVFDILYREEGMTETGCWFHARRYFWRALHTDRERAMEAIAMIAKLFEIDRECREIQMPVRTVVRAQRAAPVLEMFDKWIEHHRNRVDPRGPLDKAIGYFTNQRAALRRFLEDGRLPLDNSVSERALKNLILGRHNWLFFANETGLRWYTTFRSLIASCALHGLNVQDYLEQVLRLAPHWPVTRMLELAPMYWTKTVEGLDADKHAILVRPWDTPDAVTKTTASQLRAA
jgi:transposase